MSTISLSIIDYAEINSIQLVVMSYILFSRLLQEDNDHCLFTVTLFNKVIDEYKHHCRENKFIVRDFVYNEEELIAGKNEINKLATDKKKQFVSAFCVCVCVRVGVCVCVCVCVSEKGNHNFFSL